MQHAKKKNFDTTSLISFWQTYRKWIVLFILGNLCDGASTIYFMLTDPMAEELHPVIAMAAHILGPVGGPLLGIIGKVLAGLIVALYLHRFGRLGPICLFLIGIILSFWAAWYNMWGVEIYTPRIMQWLTF